jgi:hypothetical protein
MGVIQTVKVRCRLRYRRIRQCLWKQWKKPGRREEMLKKHCLPQDRWKLNDFHAYSSNRHWYFSKAVLNAFIPKSAIIQEYGLLDIEAYYRQAHARRMETDRRVRESRQLTLGFGFD